MPLRVSLKRPKRSAWLRELERSQEVWEYAQADSHDRAEVADNAQLSEALAFRATDPEQALALLRGLAETGSPLAADAMGQAYLSGSGVPANRTAAQHWFKQAFERGSLRGMLNYGKMLLSGRHLDEAEAVFAAGAKDGWAPAIYWTARIQAARSGSRALPHIRPLLEQATAAGSPEAKILLAGLMLSGRYGLGSIPKGFALAYTGGRRGTTTQAAPGEYTTLLRTAAFEPKLGAVWVLPAFVGGIFVGLIVLALAVAVAVSGGVGREGRTPNYYPDRALRMNIAGESSVRCRVTGDGHLVDCIVTQESPPGYGFGDATVAFVEHTFKVSPRRDGILPAAVRIRIAWKLPSKRR
jgi:TonB family protein